MRVLVTGASGFIGKHLCRRLHDDGHEVLGIDINSKSAGLACERLTCDVRDIDGMMRLAGWNVDHIYHLACVASPKAYQADPLGTMATSIDGTRNVLNLARINNARVLFASTSEVYGDSIVSPQDENYLGNVNCIGPRACYDEGKRAAEAICCDYRRMRGADVTIARIFNTYGPGMLPDDGRVVSTFIRQAIQDEPLTIYGDGSQTRSYCYIDDTIEGLVRLMNSEHAGPVNIGNPKETCSVRELAAILDGIIGHPLERQTYPLPVDDPCHRCPDISRAKKLLDWEPQVWLWDGLARTVDWMRSHLGVNHQTECSPT